MTQEEKDLLIEVLAASLLYGIKVQVCNITDYTPVLKGIIGDEIFVQFDYARPIKNGDSTYNIIKDKVKPYLRPMSSMTEEEKEELESISSFYFNNALDVQIQKLLKGDNKDGSRILEYVACTKVTDWLNVHHFDYCGLIEKGFALEAPKNMYKF